MRNIKLRPDLPFTVPEIEDITDKLAKHKTKVYPLLPIEAWDTITVHHFASEAPLVNQAKYHVNGRGWAAIGYKMVVSDGKLYQCADLLAQTNHSAGHNHHSASISVKGDLSKRPMTSLERELLYAGILTLKYYLPHIKYIVGHNEQGPTACPCTSMNQIRADIAKLERDIAYQQSEAYNTAVATETYAKFTFAWNAWRDVNNPDRAKYAKLFKKTEVTMKEDGLW